jgi:MFS family permease
MGKDVDGRWKILLYCGALIALIGFADPQGGLIGLPVSFLLKNKLHLKAHELANFKLWAALPLYGAALFGFARDRTSPLGRGDRGHLIVFGLCSSLLYAGFAFAPVGYGVLLAAILLVTCSTQMLWSAQAGLTAVLARRRRMSGEVSAVWSVIVILPGVASSVLGGTLSDVLEKGTAQAAARTLLLCGAALTLAVTLFGLLKPVTIFPEGERESEGKRAAKASLLADLGRLARHRPIYPALLAYILWAFTPGTGTPLQYHLANTLHATDSQWGQFLAITSLSMIPTFLLFGFLASRAPLGRLLAWSVVIGAPGLIPMLFVHSATGALVLAVLFGLSCGLGNAAFLNLMIRVCPTGLEGTMMMLAGSMVAIAARFGDVLGAALYDRWHNFTVCVAVGAATTAAILLVLPFLPKAVTADADGWNAPGTVPEPAPA